MITFYSIIWTLINCILMSFVIFILRTRTNFLARYGSSVLSILTIFCIIRILFPIEFPEHQFVIADSYIYSNIIKPFNILLIPSLPERIFQIFLFIWICGCIFHIIRLSIKSKNVQKIIRENACEKNVRGSEVLASIDSSCTLPVRTCFGISVPVLAGYFKQGIYLPDYPYTDQELHYIVLHEYTHWKRKDIWKKLLMNTICVLVWWNPAVYSIRKAFSQLLEFNCDKILAKNISEEDVVDYLDTLRISFARSQNATITTSLYTIEFVNTSKKAKATIRQRFDLLLQRNSTIRKKILPKCIIVLVGAIWMCCSYYFILQTNYNTPEHSLWYKDIFTDKKVINIADDNNAYLEEQKDGSYIFYYDNFSMPVSSEDMKSGLYDFYPIIEYEENKNFIQTIISKITDWIK